nr:zincin-like metallopeptidase toxin domain-containing protein [Flavobacterium sp. SaA2.13]
MAGISTSYTIKEIYEAEKPITNRLGSRYLQLEGKLNKEEGVINLKKDSENDVTVGLDFEFDLSRRKVIYKAYFYYVGTTRYLVEKDSKGEIAVIIKSSIYEDFEELLKLCNLNSNSNFQNKVKNAFLEALKKTEELDNKGYYGDYNYEKFFRLNWLYEYIPRFVAEELDFANTLSNVFALTEFDHRDRLGNDTTRGVAKILTKLNPETTYDYFNKNPQQLIDLFHEFDDENAIKEFCTYFTGLSFLKAGEDINPRTFTVSEDGNSHIETNILFGDEEGKVEITNELQLPVFRFDGLGIFTYLFGEDVELNNPDSKSNQFHPLDIIYIKKFDADLNEVEIIPTIALYGKYLGDKREWSDVTDVALAVVDIISIITSGGALSAGVRGAARLFAVIDIAVSTINLGITIPGVKEELNKTEAGRWFVSHWGVLSFCFSAGTISYYLAKGIIKHAAKFKEQVKNNKQLTKKVDDLVQESEKVIDNADELDFLAKWGDDVPVSRKGYLGSPTLRRSRIQYWYKEIKALNKETELVILPKEHKLLKGNRAAFNPFTNKIYVQKGMTEYEIFHEYKHLEEYTKLGKEEYIKGSKALGGSPEQQLIREYKRENYVYQEILKSNNKFSQKELDNARKYINKIIKDCEMNGINIDKL